MSLKKMAIILICTFAFTTVPANAVVTILEEEIAHDKTITFFAGSTQQGDLQNLVDGDTNTFWQSNAEGLQGICIDLGRPYVLTNISVIVPENLIGDPPPYFTFFLTNNPNGGHGGDVNAEPVVINNALPVQTGGAGDGTYSQAIDLDTAYRYVKVQNITGVAFGFSEIEIMADVEQLDYLDAAAGKNVAINAGATLEGEPTAVVDGNDATYWMSQGTHTVLQIDLGRLYDIAEIQVDLPQAVLDQSSGSYTVGLSNSPGDDTVDPIQYTTRIDPSTGQFTHLFSAAEKFRYIKFVTYQGQPYGFSEINVFVKDPYFTTLQAFKGGETVTSLSGGVDEVVVEMVDNRDTAESFTLLAVLYDEKGQMISCCASESIPERGKSAFSLNVSKWNFTEGQTMSVALLNNLNNMHLFQPLLQLEY